MLFKSLLLAAAAGLTLAQRPANESICDYYTTALLTNNTGANQYTLLTVLVNTVVIGNYTPTLNKGVTVPGILAAGEYNGTAVNLAPFFTGALASSNRGGSSGVAVNFLDGGGAAPLMMNMPANSTTSNQYGLLTHLYEFFGLLLGCTEVGMTGFPAYAGQPSMYSVHKFMVLTPADMGYFITQVALAAESFGVATADIQAVGEALGATFNYKCLPEATVVPSAGPQYQSICTDATCPLLAANDTCAAQATIAAPMNATAATTFNGTATAAASGAASGSSTAKASGSAASGSAAPAATTAAKSSAVKQVVSYAGLALVGAAALYTL